MSYYCPWCHKDLGDRRSSRHRHCEFAPSTPWGGWQERYVRWLKRQERMQGEAYANLSRLLFQVLAPEATRTSYAADQNRQLRQNVEEAKDSQTQLRQLLSEAELPATPLSQEGFEHLRALKTQAILLEARLDEIQSMRRYLEER